MTVADAAAVDAADAADAADLQGREGKEGVAQERLGSPDHHHDHHHQVHIKPEQGRGPSDKSTRHKLPGVSFKLFRYCAYSFSS